MFRTKYGFYESTVLPFGLTNAPAVFLNLMKDVCRHFLSDFTGVYLDDILVCNKIYKYHPKHLRQAVDKLPEHKAYAKLSTCQVARTTMDYLVHVISIAGFFREYYKVQAMRSWATPQCKKDMQPILVVIKILSSIY